MLFCTFIGQMNFRILLLCFFLLYGQTHKAQDTFSILAFDSITGEVGAAGASCIDLMGFSGYSDHFIAELIPGEGAIATQASYIIPNQANAKSRFLAGDSPTQVISWLQANDVNSTPDVRQYGVVRMNKGNPRTAAFTGTNCMNYKNHIVGPNYTIHGNILLGQQVLDSMESGFLREEGDLACKLMAAMRGAKMVGADTRCAPHGVSSHFGFLKVAQPGDDIDSSPSFLISVRTPSTSGIEPIDTLQSMFSAVRTCTVDRTGLAAIHHLKSHFGMYPNPATEEVVLSTPDPSALTEAGLSDIYGNILTTFTFRVLYRMNVAHLPRGVYFITLRNQAGREIKKLVIR